MNSDLKKWYVDNRRAELIGADRMCYSPGKFESESMETLYFYQRMMNGGGNVHQDPMTDDVFTVFELTDDEKEFFDLKTPFFAISESDQGFVYGSELSMTEYEELCNGDMNDE